MPTSSRPPTIITPDKPEEEDVGKPLRQFKFVNRSRYTILIAWGWDPLITELDPDYVIEPYTSQIIMPEQPQERFIWLADTGWGSEAPRQSGQDTFSWVATDRISAIAAVSSSATDILTQPPTDVTGVFADMSKVINEDTAAATSFVQGQLAADAARRINIRTDGTINLGIGVGPPEQLWEIPSNGQVRFLEDLLLAQPPGVDQAAARKSYVDALVAGVSVDLEESVFLVPANSKGDSAAPSTWTSRILQLMNRSDSAGGWPTLNGTVFSIAPSANTNYTRQLWFDRDTNNFYLRTGTSGDTWTAWTQYSTRTYAEAQATAAQAAAEAYTDLEIASILPVAVTAPGGTAAAFSVTETIRARRFGRVVNLEGEVRNTSGVVQGPGVQICTITAVLRPPVGKKFACARRDNTGAGVGSGVYAVHALASGPIDTDSPVAIGEYINLGNISWQLAT